MTRYAWAIIASGYFCGICSHLAVEKYEAIMCAGSFIVFITGLALLVASIVK